MIFLQVAISFFWGAECEGYYIYGAEKSLTELVS
jgi:hypothetical protein